MTPGLRIFAFHCGGDVSDWATFDPFDERVGTKAYNPYFMYLVQHPRGNLLFDSGVHPQMGTDPVARLGPAAASFQVQVSHDDTVEGRLATIGMTPNDVDIVVQSHLHFDHAGGLGWLTHASVLVQREELQFAYDPPIYQKLIYVPADFDHGLKWQELDGDHDVFGDGRVVIISTPGHTRGHQSLMVKLGSGKTVILLADAAYLLAKMRERALPAVLWSPDAMVASWDRIESLEREHDATLYTTHDLDFRERMKLAPEGWYE
jgi:glyoxylase-like metal-dependent hydrolase (beta-lactamase superfamily II)